MINDVGSRSRIDGISAHDGVGIRRSIRSARLNSKNGRPSVWIPWQTAKNAVSHRLLTHYLLVQTKNAQRQPITLQHPSTEPDQAQLANRTGTVEDSLHTAAC